MATDIDAGVPFRFSRETTPDVRLADACRASTSVPVIWAPAKVAGRKLVDGGVCNNIPVNQLAVDDVPRLGFEIVDGSPAGSTKTLLGLLTQTIKTALSSNEGNLVAWAKASGADIVQINAAPYGAFDTALSAAEKEDLYERGLLAAAGAAK
jgi:NTE family protein